MGKASIRLFLYEQAPFGPLPITSGPSTLPPRQGAPPVSRNSNPSEMLNTKPITFEKQPE